MEKVFIKYPKDDEYMVYDYKTHRYVLTLKYVTDVLGVDLENRVNSNGAVSGQAVINRILNTASIHVYNYIFEHNINRRAQEWIIAKCPSARDIILNAMGEQFDYILAVGDLTRSADANERADYMDVNAKLILDQDVAETGAPLTSCAPIAFCPPPYKCGGY